MFSHLWTDPPPEARGDSAGAPEGRRALAASGTEAAATAAATEASAAASSQPRRPAECAGKEDQDHLLGERAGHLGNGNQAILGNIFFLFFTEN